MRESIAKSIANYEHRAYLLKWQPARLARTRAALDVKHVVHARERRHARGLRAALMQF